MRFAWTLHPLADLSALAYILTRLPNIEVLEVTRWRLPNAPIVGSSLPRVALRKLILRELRCIGDIAHGGLANILQLVSAVDTLETHFLTTSNPAPGSIPVAPPIASRSLKIKHLALDVRQQVGMPAQQTIFSRAGVLETVQTLELRLDSIVDVPNAVDFVPSGSEILSQVVIDLVPLWLTEFDWENERSLRTCCHSVLTWSAL